jgi:FtsP/CotA-like multicopper oxidase with cupredoxin domain
MSEHHHDHMHHSHGPVVHAVSPDSAAAYTAAFAAAQPNEGCAVVSVDCEACEHDWEFIPGRTTRAWCFNGQVPGPVIEARVGDVLEVRLTNKLAEGTTMHWHGLRIPAAMDGTDMVQRVVAPGETFTYRFRLPDAGTFWYHPHSHETVQMEHGLYGALVVHGPDEPVLDGDRVFVLDDVLLGDDAQVEPPGGWVERHNGREGNVRLVNGKREPEITMAGGQVERWRIINASSARYVRLSIGGRPFRIIGTDGGLIPSPVTATEVLLAAADRVELAVGPFAEGETIEIESLAYNRRSIAWPKDEHFATLRVGPAKPSRAVVPEVLRHIEPLVSGPVVPNRQVHLGVKVSLRGMDFLINGETHHRDQPVVVGQLQVWDVINDSNMDHPFHLHGFFFQVLDVDGTPPAFLSWEDTVNVGPKSTVRIAWMPDDRPGEWMYHCHILEHHEKGMMAHFRVVRADEEVAMPPAASEHHHHR